MAEGSIPVRIQSSEKFIHNMLLLLSIEKTKTEMKKKNRSLKTL